MDTLECEYWWNRLRHQVQTSKARKRSTPTSQTWGEKTTWVITNFFQLFSWRQRHYNVDLLLQCYVRLKLQPLGGQNKNAHLLQPRIIFTMSIWSFLSVNSSSPWEKLCSCQKRNVTKPCFESSVTKAFDTRKKRVYAWSSKWPGLHRRWSIAVTYVTAKLSGKINTFICDIIMCSSFFRTGLLALCRCQHEGWHSHLKTTRLNGRQCSTLAV